VTDSPASISPHLSDSELGSSCVRTSSSLRNEEQTIVSIRSGTVNDVPLLKVLIEEFAEYERLPAVIAEERLRHDGFEARPKFKILIAEIDALPAGYALFFDYYSSFQGSGIFLEDLFVRPRFRGQNVGRALLAGVARMVEEAALQSLKTPAQFANVCGKISERPPSNRWSGS
jgi:GNAT superfamily N-acetyltransferase